MSLVLEAVGYVAVAYRHTLIALLVTLAFVIYRRVRGQNARSGEVAAPYRLAWHWPAYVVAYEAVVTLHAAMGCIMPATQQDVIDNFLIGAVAAAMTLPATSIVAGGLERLAVGARTSVFPPAAVFAAFASVALAWTFVLYIISRLGFALHYVGQ